MGISQGLVPPLFALSVLFFLSPSFSAGPLDGGFLWAGGADMQDSQFKPLLEEMKSIGMDTVVVSGTREKGYGCGNLSFKWYQNQPGKLGPLLSAADSLGMKVYVGLDFTNRHGCASFYSGADKDATINDTGWAAGQILSLHGSHPSFAGWYLPDEPGITNWEEPSATYPYYKGLVDAIRAKSSKQIVISPFLHGVGSMSPSTLAQRAKAFGDATGVDIQAWQDSCGSDCNLGWTGRAGSDIGAHLSAISKAIGKERMWAVTELFCGADVSWTGGNPWPAPISRVKRQIAFEPYSIVSKRLSWTPQTQLTKTYYNRFPGAERLLSGYKAAYGYGTGSQILPVSYSWSTPPAHQYQDSSNSEMADGWTADPLNYSDGRWVGIFGNAEIRVDLGFPRRVDWISFHTLNENGVAIKFPTYLTIWISDDGTHWNESGSWGLPTRGAYSVSRADSEFVLSNYAPLGATARYFRARLTNDAWTFVSEMELSSDSTSSVATTSLPASTTTSGQSTSSSLTTTSVQNSSQSSSTIASTTTTSLPCTCSPFSNSSCGAAPCPYGYMLQTRSCSPEGCATGRTCVFYRACQGGTTTTSLVQSTSMASSVPAETTVASTTTLPITATTEEPQAEECTCSPFSNSSCNAGGCPLGYVLMERNCTPVGCAIERSCAYSVNCPLSSPTTLATSVPVGNITNSTPSTTTSAAYLSTTIATSSIPFQETTYPTTVPERELTTSLQAQTSEPARPPTTSSANAPSSVPKNPLPTTIKPSSSTILGNISVPTGNYTLADRLKASPEIAIGSAVIISAFLVVFVGRFFIKAT